ncbi:zinc-binding dehydrogenase [Microbacterium sp. X-17]|uniref:zinc-binding dehydrogenase n=1 Tax=Microbacterium sp. X-17 TaxID=3144404 RepID=UPI0031F5A588
MGITARLAVLPPGRKELELETVDLPEPGPWEVVIEQQAFGICHSQLDLIDNPSRAEPLVIGHESAGVVVATGENVTHVQPGDDVLLTWLPRDPSASRAPGASRIPLRDGRVAVTHNVFAWGTHAVVDEQYVVTAPAGLSPDLTSIIGCAVMTGAGSVLNAAGDVSGRSVAVWGLGGVGLAALSGAHALGASSLIAVDIHDEKLEVARSMGATHVVNARTDDPEAVIRQLTGGPGVDVGFDCTGIGENLARSLGAVRAGVAGRGAGGTLVLVGAPRAPFSFNGMQLLSTSKTLIGALGGLCSPDRDFPVFAEWANRGDLRLDELVTNRYSLSELDEGIQDLRAGRVVGRAVVVL